jgi:ribonuclease/clavin/mitogillin
MNYAPLTDKTTGSSYPHWFTNGYDEDGNHKWGYTVITFGNSDCDAPPKHKGGSDDHYLLEFPTFPDGHEYNYNSKFPKDDPGPARVIFTYPHKTFCGIVSHTMGNLGDLKLCDH